MADGKDVQFISPNNRLKMKVGGGDGPMKIDPEAIKRAEKALEELAKNFDGWLGENLEQLRSTFSALRAANGDTEENRQGFYTAAHDLKGLGSTLGYPLVTRISGSLSRLVEGLNGLTVVHMSTIVSHVDALTAIVAQSVRGADDNLGAQLAAELEDLVDKALAD